MASAQLPWITAALLAFTASVAGCGGEVDQDGAPPVDEIASAQSGDCYGSFAGNVYRTGLTSAQGSATTRCSGTVYDLYVRATLQWSTSPNGPWYDHVSADGYGGWPPGQATAIAYGQALWGRYMRVLGYHRWRDQSGWTRDKWSVGSWSYIY